MMDNVKRFRDYTDEEVILEALKAIPDYLETIRATGRFEMANCMSREFKRVETLFRTSNGLGIYGRLNVDDEADLNAALSHIGPMLSDRTREIQVRYTQSRRVSQINATSAEVLISKAMEEAGLSFTFEAQRYRARVGVGIGRGAVLRFYVKYSDLRREGLLEGIMQAVFDMRDAIGRLSPGVTIKRI